MPGELNQLHIALKSPNFGKWESQKGVTKRKWSGALSSPSLYYLSWEKAENVRSSSINQSKYKKNEPLCWDDIPMVSYIWQNITSSFCLWSFVCAEPRYTHRNVLGWSCWLQFITRLSQRVKGCWGYRHSPADESLPSHPTGLCAKGHKDPESPLPVHAQRSHKTRTLCRWLCPQSAKANS